MRIALIQDLHRLLEIYTRQDFPLDWARIQINLGNAYRDSIEEDKEENIELAIACYRNALKVCTREKFPLDWASTQYNLGVAYNFRIKEDEEENIESAIICFEKALEVYTRQDFSLDWARSQNALGNVYQKRVKGNKEENIESAIACYRNALKVCTREDFPLDWARSQDGLGIAYNFRIKEDKEENIESAIAFLKKALEVYTRENLPLNWARTQNNLGNAYRIRIKEDKEKNIESAIACYRNALKVCTREDFILDWARTQHNLGVAYKDRIKEDKKENIELAITCYRNALEVYTRQDFPLDWSQIQNGLGIAYSNRIKEDKKENIELAIACYRNALEVYTRQDFPLDWASIQNNLGNAYRERITPIEKDEEENIELAIACYRNALEVYTRQDFPLDWSQIQNNLGNAYNFRIKEDEEENIELAIACYRNALEVRTREDFPLDWASTQNNLSAAYGRRIKEDEEENIESAIACLRKASEVFTRQDFSLNWAQIQNNLGNAYRDRIKEDKKENIELAIAYYQKALEVYTRQDFPLNCLNIRRKLGYIYSTQKKWQEAIESYQIAIEILEDVRLLFIYENKKQAAISRNLRLFAGIIHCYVQLKQYEKAIEYVERSKTRNLVELIATRNLKPRGNFPPYILTKLDRLQSEIRTEQILANKDKKYNAFSKSGQLYQAFLHNANRLKQLQQELDELIQRDISPIDPNFSLTQKVVSIPFSNIQSLIDESTAIVEWYIAGGRILTFLVTYHNPKPRFWQFSTDELTNLGSWSNKYLKNYYKDRSQWKIDLETSLQKLAELLHLEEILSCVPEECDRLILIPHRGLHIFPLHALPVGKQKSRVKSQNLNSKCLFDLFPRGVQYAPSCQLLQLVQRQQRPNLRNLFAIQDPSENLIYSNLEVETICSFFPNGVVLAKQAASKASLKLHQNLPVANCVHFSCHGLFNQFSPLESHLVLAAEEANKEDGKLTLEEIFELSLQQCRLVTLSACETGLTDYNSLSDEYIGLPSGFLFAGSPSVVSSLWKVDDLVTAFLMVKFYENLPQSPQAGEVAISLKKAQQSLRNLTVDEFNLLLEKFKPQLDLILEQLRPGQRIIYQEQINQIRQQKPHPFANPYYWASFTAIGF